MRKDTGNLQGSEFGDMIPFEILEVSPVRNADFMGFFLTPCGPQARGLAPRTSLFKAPGLRPAPLSPLIEIPWRPQAAGLAPGIWFVLRAPLPPEAILPLIEIHAGRRPAVLRLGSGLFPGLRFRPGLGSASFHGISPFLKTIAWFPASFSGIVYRVGCTPIFVLGVAPAGRDSASARGATPRHGTHACAPTP